MGGALMASLGDVGRMVRLTRAPLITLSIYSRSNSKNTAAGTGATANALIVVFQPAGGYKVDSTRADGAGDWHVYDLDNGTYFASEVGSSNAWEIVVSGTSATVTALSGGGSPGTSAFAYIGCP